MTSKLLLVNFHHVREGNPREIERLHHRTPSQVVEQLELLGRRFDFPSPEIVRDALLEDADLGADSCVLSFDDGLRDHHDVVLALLADLKISAVFAVNTGPWKSGKMLSVHMAHLLAASTSYRELGPDFEAAALHAGLAKSLADVDLRAAAQQYRYDTPDDARVKSFINAVLPQELRETVLRHVFELRMGDDAHWVSRHYLSPEMAGELARAGHTLGLHTHGHLNLAASSRALRRDDLELNRRTLLEVSQPGADIRWISYPYGSPATWNDDVIADARDCGCDVGLTMTRGVNHLSSAEAMKLKRVDTNDVEGGKSPIDWEELLR
ncbi:MAG: polysaccharide deacetylase family protein [Archangiaceae bacterium]|nr:polysaccharide deacetylase family protein [Archangiaceae bacterium]